MTTGQDATGDVVDSPCFVTLVHGTGARGAAWCKSDSKLCAIARSALGDKAIFDIFEWSGANSHRARILAAYRLRDHILHRHHDHPDSVNILIGHSHGGNVIRYALRDPNVANSVHGVATLATPFILALPRTFSAQLQTFIRAVTFGAIVFAAAAVFGIFAFPILLIGSEPLMRVLSNGAAINLIIMPLIGALVYGLRWLYVKRIGEYVAKLHDRLIVRQAALMRQIDPPLLLGLPLLALAAERDEAGIFLSAAAAPSQMLFRLITSRWFTLPMIFIGLPCGVMAAFSLCAISELPSIRMEDFLMLYTPALAIGMLVLAPLFFFYLLFCLSLSRLFHAPAFGEEGFIDNWMLDINQSQTPFGWEPHECETIETGHSRGKWRHSLIYETDKALDTLGRWLRTIELVPRNTAVEVLVRKPPVELPFDIDALINSSLPPQLRDGGAIVRNMQ